MKTYSHAAIENPNEYQNFKSPNNLNVNIKTIQKKVETSKRQLEKIKNAKNEYHEIMNRIVENDLLSIKIPPSLNHNIINGLIKIKTNETLSVQAHMTTKINNVQKLIVNLTTKALTDHTNFRLFEIGGYCEEKNDGLYTDLEDCDNFIICYAGRTFRTKCAIGTKWNHWRKECDYPEKVDCERKPTTVTVSMEMKNLTSIKETVYSIFTKRTFKTRPNVIDNKTDDITYNMRTKANIVLISILIPIAIIALIVLFISLWIWNRTFKQQKKRLESRRKNKNSNNSNFVYNDEVSKSQTYENKFNSKCFYFCNKKHNSFKPNIKHSNNKHSIIKSLKSQSNTTYPIKGYKETQKTNNIIQLTPIENCCPITSNSRATLSSHFEENNWDYNFATRGLYLTQPWLTSEHSQTIIKENYSGSLILTLNSDNRKNSNGSDNPIILTNNDSMNNKNDNNINNHSLSEIDGYYA